MYWGRSAGQNETGWTADMIMVQLIPGHNFRRVGSDRASKKPDIKIGGLTSIQQIFTYGRISLSHKVD
jgi:hypothetical protein